jgi:hypothetical protein
MYPPADPWGVPDEPVPPLPPRSPFDRPQYGRASVPVPVLREPTAEMPTVPPRAAGRSHPVSPVSWQRSSRASLRSLADGWGFTATGLLAMFCGWGLWAAAGRGTIAAPLFGMVLVLLVAAGVFAISRLLGFVVLQRMMGRPRLHARWAHFLTGLFLTVAGVSYLAATSWIVSGVDWIREQWQRLG